jgi:alkanesulfonate monooxygenase SsuD/methylene tetrahydromethanopterin reductase-like flavin-dependent oxidoreductase (luciferase family)
MAGRPPLRGTALALAGSTIRLLDGVATRVPLPIDDLSQAADLAEETGYRAVFVPDHGVWDPFGLLTSFAQRTSMVQLATGVVTVTTRPAQGVGVAAATLDRVSGGRAVLGLGSGPEPRLDRVAAYLDELRGHLPHGVPLYLAALGDRMVGLAGDRADTVLLNWCAPARVARARERLPGRVTVAVYVRACLGHEEDHALTALREAAALYVGVPAYRRQFEADGLGPDPEAIARGICAWGGRDQALARLDEYREAGADLVVVYPVTAQEPASSLQGTIMAAAPDPSVEA